MRVFWITLLGVALLPFLLIGGCTGVAWRQDSAAKRFCESLIPGIEKARELYGQYPTQVDPAWWAGKEVPSLIDTQAFYFSTGGQFDQFGFHFQNDMWVFDNVWGFRNDGKGWYGYDANRKRK